MRDSGLITYSAISPNCNRPRRYPISKITPHHMAGNLSLKQIAEIEGRPARRMSSNYAIASNGDIALLCHEADRSWCSSSPENDHRAITIEVANDQIGGNWPVSDAAFESLIALCVDICQRYPALASGLNYTGDARGNLTKHSYFKNTACPGPYLGSRFGDLAKEVIRLCETESEFHYCYETDTTIEEKLDAIVKKIYHGDGVVLTDAAKKQAKRLTELGFGNNPISKAKTQYSFSDNAKLLGAPKNFTVTVRNLKVSAGAGFIVALTGDIMTMPGLPKVPAAEKLDVDENGRITGLF